MTKHPLGKHDRTIHLQTREGKDIDNFQTWAMSHFEWSQLSSYDKYKPPSAKRLGDACPIFNCHGLTFGSRRTQVDDSTEEISNILNDDGYEEVKFGEAQAGDVIVYIEYGAIQHTGIIIEVVEVTGVRSLRVWSKWGKGPEFVHMHGACPYNAAGAKFYRLKKWKRLLV